jgi:hypothetical protein
MALTYKGTARTPGPLGIGPEKLGGRIPGPLRFEHIDLSKSATKAAAKRIPMPPPAEGSTTIIRARAVDWRLSGKSPRTEDVKQGELATCPIGAILAALAHTTNGQRRINNLIKEYFGIPVKTTLSQEVLVTVEAKTKGEPDYRAQEKEVVSKRYFSVALDSPQEVSEVFYVKYTDGSDVEMVYMGSPNDVLWPSVIEKAYAQKVGSYQELDDDSKHSVEEFWISLVGSRPNVLEVDKKTDLGKIRHAANNASRIPTIGASRDDATKVLSHHGFAILGMKGTDTVLLYNPHGKKEQVTLAEFGENFQRIYFG